MDKTTKIFVIAACSVVVVMGAGVPLLKAVGHQLEMARCFEAAKPIFGSDNPEALRRNCESGYYRKLLDY